MDNRKLKNIIEEIKEAEEIGLSDIATKLKVDRSYLSKLINSKEPVQVTVRLFTKFKRHFPGYFPQFPENNDGKTTGNNTIEVTTDLAKWMGEIQEEVIRLRARATVMQVTLEKLVSDSTGKGISTVAVELKKAVDDLEKMLFDELREPRKKH